MKFRIYRELKNMILSIHFAILWNILGSVGMKTFLFFFFKAIKIAGSTHTKKKEKKKKKKGLSG